jgi:DNA-binding NtrC family response regulator
MAGNESVLLVEDEDGVRSLGRRILERNGYLVFEAEDGEEALEICDQIDGAVDILVTDVVMPHISGSRLAERITERYPHIRVLYVSGYAEGVIDVGGHLEPGTAFLEKPFSVDSLLRAVRSELDSED